VLLAVQHLADAVPHLFGPSLLGTLARRRGKSARRGRKAGTNAKAKR
jgi:hypothetical protein